MRRLAILCMIFLVAGLRVSASAADSASPPGQPSEVHPVERMRSPRLIRKTLPDFPEAARRQGIKEASVFVQFLIDRRGRVMHPRVLQCASAGHGFEAAALKAVKRWRYEPAEMNGDVVEVYQTVEVKFDAAASPPSPAVLVSPPSHGQSSEEAPSCRS